MKNESPELFDFNEENYAKIMKLYESGFCYPLPGRDSNGQKYIMVTSRKWNTDLFTEMDAIRLLIYVSCVLLEEEETQICGISYIYDTEGTTMKHFISPVCLKNYINSIVNLAPMRLKEISVINLPSFAAFFVEIMLKFLKEKLRKRVHVLKPNVGLDKHINLALLPKVHGGLKAQTEIMQEFLFFEKEKRGKVLEYLNLKIGWKSSQKIDEGTGSFRKLEID